VNEILDAALAFADAGCSVVPAMADGSKSPAGKWQRWQSEQPGAAQVTEWLSNGRYSGFGLVCGQVSGALEMLELEGRAVRGGLTARYRDALTDHGLGDVWRRIVTGYAETTPGGGLHILYRVDGTPRGNTKLAVTASGDVLIETRGEGGFVIVAPSGGSTHPTGKPWQLAKGGPGSIAVITEDERDALYAVASLLTEQAPRQPVIPSAATGSGDAGNRPGDDYNARASWQEILAPHGWQCVRAFGPGAHGWRRPGKDGPGISATTRDAGGLYVFSTSTPFATETPYSKFGAYTVLNHGGDHAAAAAALRRDGYGTLRERDDDGIADLIASGTAPDGSSGWETPVPLGTLAALPAFPVDVFPA
jgi:putative DNA primase/helicase